MTAVVGLADISRDEVSVSTSRSRDRIVSVSSRTKFQTSRSRALRSRLQAKRLAEFLLITKLQL